MRLAAFLSLLAMLPALAGCQTTTDGGPASHSAPAALSAGAADAIAADLAVKLAEAIGQGGRTVVLKPTDDSFGPALEASLKTWGFAVSAESKEAGGKAIAVSYALASHEGLVLAQLSAGRTSVGRAYTVTDAGARPASPVSVASSG